MLQIASVKMAQLTVPRYQMYRKDAPGEQHQSIGARTAFERLKTEWNLFRLYWNSANCMGITNQILDLL